MGARDTALSVLLACSKNGAWSDGALKQRIRRDGLDQRDAALASQLCYGVLQNRLLLDHWIGLFAKSKLQPAVAEILRLAVYQITEMDKIPPSAAVNEAVEQAKRFANERAAGFVNAVLRNLMRSRHLLTLPESLSLRYSHPEPLVTLLRENVGDAALEPLLAAHNSAAPTYLQVNFACSDEQTVRAMLEADGLRVQAHPWLEGCLSVAGGSIEETSAFRDGLIYVQDPAAKLAALTASPEPEMRVLDCCGAPGGKSFAAAIEMKNRGEIVCCDIHPHKVELIRRGAVRLKLSCIRALLQDASVPREDWLKRYDVVLADVPCSGLGVIRKKPDIRYKPLAPLEALPAIQSKILATQALYVKPGGVLLYSTCTLLRRENEAVVAAFLNEHADFTAEAFSLPNGVTAPEGHCTLLPSVHGTDGFFICKLRRNA